MSNNLTYNSPPKEKSEDLVMPHCLVTCASLEVLRLTLPGRRLILPSYSGFPALKVLELSSLELFDDDLVKKFLESCPLLEDLTLFECMVDKLGLLCISCPKLKKLKLVHWENYELCGCLKLSCPNLVFLDLKGELASSHIFENLYSLKGARIYPDWNAVDTLFHTMSRLFHGVSHVEYLNTGLRFLYKCIDAAPDLALPNLKTLELVTLNDNYTVKALTKIVKCCPNLESLCILFEICNDYDPELYDATEYPMLDEPEVGRILTPDVRWVEFFELNGEKPKLDIKWCEVSWYEVIARWGKAAKSFSGDNESDC